MPACPHAPHRTQVDKTAAKARDAAKDVGRALNPIAKYGDKAQAKFALLLGYTRALGRLFTWGEPIVTFWMLVLCATAAVTLAVLPWGILLRGAMQLVGIAAIVRWPVSIP